MCLINEVGLTTHILLLLPLAEWTLTTPNMLRLSEVPSTAEQGSAADTEALTVHRVIAVPAIFARLFAVPIPVVNVWAEI